jgi:Homing endonuclease associated repeat
MIPGAAAAFERRFREEVAAGRSPDALRRYCEDEVERFWSRTVAGADGHVYWDGPRDGFICNDGRKRAPGRWVWKRRHGAEPTRNVSVVAVCGERNCIAPEHLALTVRNRTYTDEQAIGAAQVWAMRNGRPPTTADWEADLSLRPCRNTITARWKTWARFLQAAGLAS